MGVPCVLPPQWLPNFTFRAFLHFSTMPLSVDLPSSPLSGSQSSQSPSQSPYRRLSLRALSDTVPDADLQAGFNSLGDVKSLQPVGVYRKDMKAVLSVFSVPTRGDGGRAKQMYEELGQKMGFYTETEKTIFDQMADFLKELGTTKKDKSEAHTLRLPILAGLVDDEEDGHHNVGASPNVLSPTSMT